MAAFGQEMEAMKGAVESRSMDALEMLKAQEERVSKQLLDIRAAITLMEENPKVADVLKALSKVRAIF